MPSLNGLGVVGSVGRRGMLGCSLTAPRREEDDRYPLVRKVLSCLFLMRHRCSKVPGGASLAWNPSVASFLCAPLVKVCVLLRACCVERILSTASLCCYGRLQLSSSVEEPATVSSKDGCTLHGASWCVRIMILFMELTSDIYQVYHASIVSSIALSNSLSVAVVASRFSSDVRMVDEGSVYHELPCILVETQPAHHPWSGVVLRKILVVQPKISELARNFLGAACCHCLGFP